MPVPKRRRSKAKKRNHIAQWTVDVPQLISCSNCQTKIRPHMVCPACGYYKNQPVIQIKQKISSTKES